MRKQSLSNFGDIKLKLTRKSGDIYNQEEEKGNKTYRERKKERREGKKKSEISFGNREVSLEKCSRSLSILFLLST